MQRAGRVWVSGEASPPPLVDGEFADGWLLLGHIADHTEDAIRLELRRAQNGSRGKAVEFFVLADVDVDVTAVPEKVWVGVDPTGHGGTTRLVSAARARQGRLRRRPPEPHPGILGPQRFVGLHTATAGGVSFRRAT